MSADDHGIHNASCESCTPYHRKTPVQEQTHIKIMHFLLIFIETIHEA